MTLLYSMEVPASSVRRSPFQLRPVKYHTREYIQLRNSIDRQGILQPILVRERDGGYEIIDGAHRFECACDLRMDLVPVHAVEMTDQQVLAAQISANTQRIQTLDADLARRIWKISKQLPVHELAHQLGKSVSWVKRVCGMEKLRPEIMELFDTGKVTFRKAYLLSHLPRENQMECWPLDEPELQYVVREVKASGRVPPRQEITPMYRSLQQTLEELRKPCEAGRIILNETDSSPLEVWKAALRWVTQMDDETRSRRISKLRYKE